jgi:hypothetical protein
MAAKKAIAELAERERELMQELRELREEIAQRAGEEDTKLRQSLARKK